MISSSNFYFHLESFTKKPQIIYLIQPVRKNHICMLMSHEMKSLDFSLEKERNI